MATIPPQFDSTEDVLNFIPENDFGYYDRLDKEEIRSGYVCTEDKPKYGASDDAVLYKGDKQAIAICEGCGGYYGILLHNH